jgi:hypothetical protein
MDNPKGIGKGWSEEVWERRKKYPENEKAEAVVQMISALRRTGLRPEGMS